MTPKKKVYLYDTTLRDGTQSEMVSLSVMDKVAITERLDEFGIHYIEGGYPGSNPKDKEYFERAKQLRLKTAKLCAFGMTRRVGKKAAEDANMKALLSAETLVITVVGKSWDFHVIEALRTTKVIGGIYWQALRLWLKRVPVHAHPKKIAQTGGADPAKTA